MPEWTIDTPNPPAPGDVLYPVDPECRAWYVVEAIRPVESKTHPDRWRLRVRRRPSGEPEAGARFIGWTRARPLDP